MIHYQNPKIVVGCISEWEDRILLCRRAIEPRYGLWTLPAGFMENEETTEQGAVRETFEEARAKVKITDLYSVFSIPYISQVYLMFRGALREPDFGPGAESLEVRLVAEHEVPWDQIAFPVVKRVLKLYFADRARGRFAVHIEEIRRPAIDI
jgi:ADP-ribose pyrophosphatase YjhB (NUDIX family)